MDLTERIGELLIPYLEEGKYFVVKLTVKPVRSVWQVTVLLDCDEGITIDECASVSRRLANDLEVEEIFDSAYNLEVSSPGLDQPLVLDRQFLKNIGRNLKMVLKDGSTIEGKLSDFEQGILTIELPLKKKKSKPAASTNGEELPLRVSKEQIEKAYLQISLK